MGFPERLGVVSYQLVKAKKSLDASFNELRRVVDASAEDARDSGDWLADRLVLEVLKDGNNEMFSLMKANKSVQDKYLLKLRKRLGLTKKKSEVMKMRTEKQGLKLPGAAEMFKDVQKGKRIMAYPRLQKQEESELETCIINHMENDNMTREEATEACSKGSEEREDTLAQDDKVRKTRVTSAKDIYADLMEKKGHNF